MKRLIIINSIIVALLPALIVSFSTFNEYNLSGEIEISTRNYPHKYLFTSYLPAGKVLVQPDKNQILNKMTAEIITVGDEILIGQIIDTNSAWIAEKLNLHDIEIYQITSVHDDPEQIKEALGKAEKNADIIIMTGGLGPTIDDITKPVLCDYFKTKLIFHEPSFQNIKKLTEKRGIAMNRFNRGQAMVPETCTVLPNKVGTAPGLWFEKNDIIFIALPGVPFEMKHIMENQVLPRLRENKKIRAIFHKTVLTQGLPESALSERLENWEKSLPKNIKPAYLPDLSGVRIRLSALGTDKKILEQQVETEIKKLNQLIPDHIFGYDNQTIAEVIGNILTTKGKTLAVAENFTGGYISHLISSDPSSKIYFKGGITSGFNGCMQNVLKKDTGNSIKHAEAGEPAAKKMAMGIRNLAKTDYAIATTGIISDLQGNDESEAETVWIAVAGPHGTVTESLVFGNNHEHNVILASQTALQILRRMVSKD